MERNLSIEKVEILRLAGRTAIGLRCAARTRHIAPDSVRVVDRARAQDYRRRRRLPATARGHSVAETILCNSWIEARPRAKGWQAPILSFCSPVSGAPPAVVGSGGSAVFRMTGS